MSKYTTNTNTNTNMCIDKETKRQTNTKKPKNAIMNRSAIMNTKHFLFYHSVDQKRIDQYTFLEIWSFLL